MIGAAGFPPIPRGPTDAIPKPKEAIVVAWLSNSGGQDTTGAGHAASRGQRDRSPVHRIRQKGLASLSAKTGIEGWRKRGEGSTTDQELLISTLRKAGQILGEYYLEPGPRDAVSNGRDDRRQKVREAAKFVTAPVKVE